MKSFLILCPALLLLTLSPAFAQADDPTATEDQATRGGEQRFWQCQTPTGSFIVPIQRIASVGIHEYVVDGGFYVTEVTVDTVGSVIARFYYGEPYQGAEHGNIGALMRERSDALLEAAGERTDGAAQDNIAVKNYPATTHARTVEFKIARRSDLVALYESASNALLTGRGSKFTIGQ